MQMIETLDDCFLKTADNIMKHYGKSLARLGIILIGINIFFPVSAFYIFYIHLVLNKRMQ